MRVGTITILMATLALTACKSSLYKTKLQSTKNYAISRVKDMALEGQTYSQKHGKQQTIKAALASIKEEMKDPDSTKFKDVEYRSYNNGIVICGLVNSKNSFGGYNGFKRFVASPSDVYLYNDDTRIRAEERNLSNAGIYEACGALTY